MIGIDGENYDVKIVEVVMKADALDKFAERTVDGVLHRELIGIFYNFELRFEAGYRNPLEYARLWRKLTENVPFHNITLWDEVGPYTFSGYFAGTQHRIFRLKDGTPLFKELSTSVVAQSPRA